MIARSLAAFLLLISITAPAQKKGYFDVCGRSVKAEALDREINAMLRETGLPALSLAVISNNKVVYYNAYGYRDLQNKIPADKETVFEAASLSKSYLVYAAFKLVDEGKLDLDKPMYQYRDPGPQFSNHPWYKRITPRMILSHSSGIENWQRYNNPDSLEIVNEPGTSFVYSGTGYNLLADVIATIVKKPYEEYLQDLVIDPLKLKHSYTRYITQDSAAAHKTIPWNYAIGYDAFGKPYNKWLHPETVPASGNNVTAEDYANLIIGLFDGRHLSAKSRNTILQPVVKSSKETDDPPAYYGTGFEMYYIDGDTIVSHGGDNLGFKGMVFYSTQKKCGFVYFCNSEQGKIATSRISDLTAAFDLKEIYGRHYPDQYPSSGLTLLRTYREAGADAMWAQLANMKLNNQLPESSLYTLGWELIAKDRDQARKVFEEALALYPMSATTYGFLGEMFYRDRKYDQAYRNYILARELKYRWEPLDKKIQECAEKIADAQRRRALWVNINADGESTVPATEYNTMDGAQFGPVEDSTVKQTVAYLGSGTWLGFKTRVSKPGDYVASFRVSSRGGGNQLQVWLGEKLVNSIDVPATKAWTNWITLTAPVNLTEGAQLLRVHAASQGGGFCVSRVKFSPVTK